MLQRRRARRCSCTTSPPAITLASPVGSDEPPAFDATSLLPRISQDGSAIVFQSTDARLVRHGISTESSFRYDMASGSVSSVSPGRSGRPIDSLEPTVSADGRLVAYSGTERDAHSITRSDVYAYRLPAGCC